MSSADAQGDGERGTDEARPDAIARAIEQARSAHAAGRERRAWAVLRRVARRSEPADSRVGRAMVGLLPTEPGDVADSVRARAEEAIAALDSAGAAPADRAALRARAWALALTGSHHEAITEVIRISGLQDTPAAQLLRRLAALALARDSIDDAHQALLAAHRALPQDTDLLLDLSLVEVTRGLPERAIPRLERVLARRPGDLDARRDLAGALVAAGRPHDAVELLSAALADHVDDLELRIELAYAALEARQLDVALRAAQAAVRRLPESDGRGHTALGSVLAARGERPAARRAFETALTRDPRDSRARRGLSALATN